MLACSFYGTPDTIPEKLAPLIEQTGADELIVAAAIWDHESRQLQVFLVNRNIERAMPLTIETNLELNTAAAEILGDSDPKIANSFENPDKIQSREFDEVQVSGRRITTELPPLSFVISRSSPLRPSTSRKRICLTPKGGVPRGRLAVRSSKRPLPSLR